MPAFATSNLHAATSTETLTAAEVTSLIATAQDIPVSVSTDADGHEVTRYSPTADADAALTRLVTAFLPAMHRAARRGEDNLGTEDAFAVAYEAFVLAVRRHDPEGPAHFIQTISTVLFRAVADASRMGDLVSVKEDVSLRYWRLMGKHDHNVNAAYAECVATNNGFNPSTFLAVHAAVGATADIDMTPDLVDEDDFVNTIATREYALWLLSQTADVQESILRLRYGFDDSATSNLLAAWNADESRVLLSVGDVLDDLQVADVLGMARSTVNRQARQALSSMRDLANEIGEE